MKFTIKNFFCKGRSFLRIWSHLLKKSLMKSFIFCAVYFMFLIILRLNLRNDLLYFRCIYFLLCTKSTLMLGSSKTLPFRAKLPKLVSHSLKILQKMLKAVPSVPDHFGTLYIKGLNLREKCVPFSRILFGTLDRIQDIFPETYFVYTASTKPRLLAGNIDIKKSLVTPIQLPLY